MAVLAIIGGGVGSVVALNDGKARIETAIDGKNRDKVIPAVGEMIAGQSGRNTGEKVDTALALLGGVKSLSTISKQLSTNSVKIMDAVEAAKTVYEPIDNANK